MTEGIRKRLWDDPNQGELARDVDDRLTALVPLALKEFNAQYSEPMYVGLSKKPKGMLLVNVYNALTQEVPQLTGGMVHFVWEGGQKRARINSIDGLTPTPGTTYHFALLLIG